MEKIYVVCNHCSEKHCCKGLCREMNDYLVTLNEKVNATGIKTFQS